MSDQEPQDSEDQVDRKPEQEQEQEQVPPQQPQTGGKRSSDERTWGMLAHLSGIVIAIIGPIIIWQTKGKEFKFVEAQAKEALNFQITVTLASFLCIPLMFILIGFLLLPVISVGYLILTIMAGIKANEGVEYKYPLCLRLVK